MSLNLGLYWSQFFCLLSADFVPPISGRLAKRELSDALRDRKKALEDELQGKLKSLQEILLQEAVCIFYFHD